MNWSELIIPAYLTALIGFLAWMVKTWLGRIEKRMDRFETIQNACQVDYERRFATWEVVRGIDAKVDDHEGRISALEAHRGGK